jgi:hypothetical protein
VNELTEVILNAGIFGEEEGAFLGPDILLKVAGGLVGTDDKGPAIERIVHFLKETAAGDGVGVKANEELSGLVNFENLLKAIGERISGLRVFGVRVIKSENCRARFFS